MRVCRRDDVDGVDVGQRVAVVGDDAIRREALADSPRAPLVAQVGGPDLGAELAEDPQVLLAPAPEADEENRGGAAHSRISSPPRSSATS
jgi:hypothetical protein